MVKFMITTETKEQESIKVIDDIDINKLAALKAKLNKKEEKQMTAKIVEPMKKSLKFGVVGLGQGGSRVAEVFYKLNYETVVVNTALQDLEHIQVPQTNKLHLEYSLGGAAKDLAVGQAAAETNKDAIRELIATQLEDCQVFLLCTSLGGGSGAGSSSVVLDILNELGKPVLCLCILPSQSEDAQTKQNSLETLSVLSKQAQAGKIQSIICVDNARIANIYSDISELSFYEVANKAIVEPLEAFNTYSMMPSPTKSLDSQEFCKLILDAPGFAVFASLKVDNVEDETTLAEAVINSLSNNLLADGFDLKQTKYCGFMVCGNRAALEKLPKSSVNYAIEMVKETCNVPQATFHGVYVTEDKTDTISIYTAFTGLGIPSPRVEILKKEVKESSAQVKTKDNSRSLTLQLNSSADELVSAAEKIKNKIATKGSALGKLMSGLIKK